MHADLHFCMFFWPRTYSEQGAPTLMMMMVMMSCMMMTMKIFGVWVFLWGCVGAKP